MAMNPYEMRWDFLREAQSRLENKLELKTQDGSFVGDYTRLLIFGQLKAKRELMLLENANKLEIRDERQTTCRNIPLLRKFTQ